MALQSTRAGVLGEESPKVREHVIARWFPPSSDSFTGSAESERAGIFKLLDEDSADAPKAWPQDILLLQCLGLEPRIFLGHFPPSKRYVGGVSKGLSWN